MDDPRFVARRFPIGSGAVESACKTLIGQRAKQAGMRWSRPGLQAVASLRALHRSGRWTAFWQSQPQRRRLPAHPRPPRSAPAPTPAAPPRPSSDPAADQDTRLALVPPGRTGGVDPVARTVSG